MAQLKNKPNSVVLWGDGDFALQYEKYLAEAGIEIAAWVQDKVCKGSVDDAKVYTPEAFVKVSKRFRSIPIIPVGRDSESDKSQFKEACLDIANRYRLSDMTVLHPAFLLDHVGLTYSNKVAIFGFEGTGNTVLNKLLQRILAELPTTHGEKEVLFEKLALEHWDLLRSTLENLLFAEGMKPYRFPNIAMGEDGFIRIYGLVKLYLAHKTCLTHEVISDALLKDFECFNYTIFMPIRNPLDAIVSSAFKSYINPYAHYKNSMALDLDISEALNLSDSPVREQWGLHHLHDLDWFTHIVKEQKKYYEAYFPLKDRLVAVKYEDLLAEPLSVLSMVCEKLGSSFTHDEISALWGELGMKPLPNNPKGHCFKPGKDKWLKYLTKKHLDILRQHGYEDLLHRLGYQFDPDGFGADFQPPATEARLSEYIRRTYQSWDSVQIKTHNLPSGLTVIGNSPALLNGLFRALMSPSKYTQFVLGSADYDNKQKIGISS